jgi:glycosyltransferase involved in cell wall biosynthesis
MDDETTKRSRQAQAALERGGAALGRGDHIEAARWLDRAHRLAPADGTVALALASALLRDGNPRAATVFAEVLATHDVREAWLGLATARFRTGDITGASEALAELLSRHKSRPDITDFADRVVRATDAPGWCGVMGDGVVVVRPVGAAKIETLVDGQPVEGNVLSAGWRRSRRASVMTGARHLIGSPISLRAIGRVEGAVQVSNDGASGWAWCPGDPDEDPRIMVGSGRARREIVATEPAGDISGLAPLARPRSFVVRWCDLPAGLARVHVRGHDGRDLPGSPVARNVVGPGPPPVRVTGGRPARRVRARVARPSANRKGSVILITHDDGGGVERRVQASIAAHETKGRRVLVLRPLPAGGTGVAVSGHSDGDLSFELPSQETALLDVLNGTEPVEIELHHFLNHASSVLEAVRQLGVPYSVHTHDFAWFCPRIALVGRGDRYCGEPAPSVCEECVAELGGYLHEDIRIATLLDRSCDVLFGARQVIAPSRDAADRMARHFHGLSPTVVPHEDDDAVPEPPPIPHTTGTVLVCVAGAIGLHKGFHVLAACARDANERALDLHFVVAGTTIDDELLMDTGRVFVTGPYRPDEAVDLIRAQNASLALLPSIWPETWCLGLTELWRAGLRVAAFDIGAPAERIRHTGRGFLLPLGASAASINDVLLNAATGRSFLPILGASAYKPSR